MKKIWIMFCLGFIGFIWTTSSFSAQAFQLQRKTGSQSQSRQSQSQVRIRGSQTPQQIQRQENTRAYTYRCRIDSTNRGATVPYFIHYDLYRENYYREHPQSPEPHLKIFNIPLRCDATQPEGKSGWYMYIEFNTLDETMNFFNFIQNKTLYGVGVPYGQFMENLEFSSYYISPQE